MVRKSMRKTRKHHKRGGSSTGLPHAPMTAPVPVSETIEQTMVGGRKHRKSHRKHKGGSVMATALLPFGLFGLQKFFQKSSKTQRRIKRIGRTATRTATRTVKRVL
jgi:hypothetical protein